MVVRRKPAAPDVEAFIQEGGSAGQGAMPQVKGNEDEVKGLKLRLTGELLAAVDAAVMRRRPMPSRHQWILEAIYEKLEREMEG
jgi:hypothetical protein